MPRPTKSRPRVNFTGLEGSFDPRLSQTRLKRGARISSQMLFTDWNQEEGKVQPRMPQRVCSSAKRLRVVPPARRRRRRS